MLSFLRVARGFLSKPPFTAKNFGRFFAANPSEKNQDHIITPENIKHVIKRLNKSPEPQDNLLHFLAGQDENAPQFFKKFNELLAKFTRQQKPYAINEIGKGGNTALHIAVSNGNYKFVEILLMQGADPNFRNLQGETAIRRAIKNNQEASFFALFSSDADILDRGSEGRTILHDAAQYSSFNVVKTLVETGKFKLLDLDYNYRNVLHYASKNRDSRVERHIIEKLYLGKGYEHLPKPPEVEQFLKETHNSSKLPQPDHSSDKARTTLADRSSSSNPRRDLLVVPDGKIQGVE